MPSGGAGLPLRAAGDPGCSPIGQVVRRRLAATTPRAIKSASRMIFFMAWMLSLPRDGRPAEVRVRATSCLRTTAPGSGWSDREQVARPGVRGGVAKLRHRPGLDLANPLPGEVEVLTNLLERPRLAPVQSEAQPQDLALTLVEG